MSESITNLSDAVAAVGALPVPVGPEPQALSVDPRIELIRRERTHCEAAQFESEDDRLPHVWGPSQYPGMEMCQRCTVRRDWAEDAEAADTVLLAEVDRLRSQVAALLAERHETNEALDDAVRVGREATVYRVVDGVTTIALYTSAEQARKHCEFLARREHSGDGVQELFWREDEDTVCLPEDGEAWLMETTAPGFSRLTGFGIAPVPLTSLFVEAGAE